MSKMNLLTWSRSTKSMKKTIFCNLYRAHEWHGGELFDRIVEKESYSEREAARPNIRPYLTPYSTAIAKLREG